MADTASGVMLHPAVGEMRDETVVIQGHAIRFVTVDLAASAADIRAQLLRCCEPVREKSPARKQHSGRAIWAALQQGRGVP